MDYSVYTMRQASRRSWRIGQARPVKVVFMAYRNTLQADALKLVECGVAAPDGMVEPPTLAGRRLVG